LILEKEIDAKSKKQAQILFEWRKRFQNDSCGGDLFKKQTVCVFIKYKIYQFERGLTQLHFKVHFQQNKRISLKHIALLCGSGRKFCMGRK